VETRLAGARASVSALNSVSVELTATVQHAATEKEILHAKHCKIQDFNTLTVAAAAAYCLHYDVEHWFIYQTVCFDRVASGSVIN